jgi:uncharacterized protein (TIGR02246 family)
MLRRRRLALLVLLTVPFPGCQPPPAEAVDTEQAVLAQERRALDQWARGNPLGYLEIDAEDVTYFDDLGAQSRIEGREAMRQYFTSLKGKIPPHRYELVDPKVQVYDDIAILTLRYHPFTPDGKPGPQWKATSVYHQLDGEWRIIHAHWSMAKGK